MLVGRGVSTSALKFSPSGKSLIFDHYDGISIYETPELKFRAEIPLRGSQCSCSISDDGRFAAIEVEGPSNGTYGYSSTGTSSTKPSTVIGELLELQTGQIFRQLPGHEFVSDLTFTSNGKMLAFMASDGAQESVEVWDTVQGRRVARLDGFPQRTMEPHSVIYTVPLSCRFLPNSNILAVVVDRKRIIFFAIPSCRRLGVIEFGSIDAFAFCPDGGNLAVGGDGGVACWRLNRAKLGGTAAAKPAAQTKEPLTTDEALSRSYESLGSCDARGAIEAVLRLCSTPDQATAFLSARVRPTLWIAPKSHALLLNLIQARPPPVKELVSRSEGSPKRRLDRSARRWVRPPPWRFG